MAGAVGCLPAFKRTLECSICLEIYNLREHLPKTLKCGHNFCTLCVDDLAKQGVVIECPTCRKQVSLSDTITNFGIADVLEALCEVCISQDKAAKCHHCSQMLCLTCLDSHAVECYEEITTDLDRLDILLQSVTPDPQVLADIQHMADGSISDIRGTIQKWKVALDNLGDGLEQQVAALHEANFQQYNTWELQINKEITKAKQFQNKARNTLSNSSKEKTSIHITEGIAIIQKCCKYFLRDLQRFQVNQPAITEYSFKEISRHFELAIGEVVVSNANRSAVMHKVPPLADQSVMTENTGTKDTPANLQFEVSPKAHQSPGPMRNITKTTSTREGQKPYLPWPRCPQGMSQSAEIYRAAKFECMTGSLGSGPEEFNSPMFVTCMDDKIVVTDTDNHRIKVYDYSLNLIHIHSEHGDKNNQFDAPFGVAVRNNNELVITDTGNHKIKIVNENYNSVKVWGYPQSSCYAHSSPTGVCVGENNIIYICEQSNKRIQGLDKQGKCVCTIADTLEGPGTLTDIPLDVATHKGRILVSQKGHPLIKVYSTSGDYITSYPRSVPDLPVTNNFQPCGIAVDTNCNILFTDGQGQLIVLDPEGEFVCTIGEPGSEPGQLRTPYGVAVTPKGDVVVCDAGNHRLQIFKVTK